MFKPEEPSQEWLDQMIKIEDEHGEPSAGFSRKPLTINIIGDIGGRYDELMLLLKKMPEADLVLAVGDLMDRGPKSRDVIQWFIDNADKAEALYGNHDDMMATNSDWWEGNGGWATLDSYPDRIPDPAHIAWLKQRPLYYKTHNLIVTHAPITTLNHLPKKRFAFENPNLGEEGDFIWNRYMPTKPIKGYFMVHGHNWQFRTYEYGCKDNTYGVCIDNTKHKELMGLHWNGNPKEFKIFSQDFLPDPPTSL